MAKAGNKKWGCLAKHTSEWITTGRHCRGLLAVHMAFTPRLGELVPPTSDFKPLDCFARVLQAAPMLAMTGLNAYLFIKMLSKTAPMACYRSSLK
jgi:hypothetical protein